MLKSGRRAKNLKSTERGIQKAPASSQWHNRMAAFAKALLERQQYPDLREYPGGPPRRPYDVTAQTLPLLMGVRAVRLDKLSKVPLMSHDHELFRQVTDAITTGDAIPIGLRSKRVAVYKSYAASMDEGWTRWILDQFRLKYSSVTDNDVRAGRLRTKFDCLIIPAQSALQIVNGLSKDRYPEEVSGGLGQAGVDALKNFVEDGGTIITLNEASQFAIDHLRVPVKNVLEGVSAKDFYCPGSILKLKSTHQPHH